MNLRQKVIKQARETYQDEGILEIDDNARVNVSDDGYYVQAWVWVDKEGAKHDKS